LHIAKIPSMLKSLKISKIILVIYSRTSSACMHSIAVFFKKSIINDDLQICHCTVDKHVICKVSPNIHAADAIHFILTIIIINDKLQSATDHQYQHLNEFSHLLLLMYSINLCAKMPSQKNPSQWHHCHNRFSLKRILKQLYVHIVIKILLM